MSEALDPSANLPGMETGSPWSPPPQVKAPSRARVKPVDRSQLVWRSVDVEHLIEEDHPARAIWAMTGELDLSGFYAPIEAVEGVAGRTPWDPRLLVSLWVYAYSRGISSAREIARACSFDPAFQWLCGMEPINYHTLSDFRVAHCQGLQELFVQLLAVLSAEGLVSLERVMHDGTKIKAFASSDSFRQEDRLQAHLKAARQQLESLEAQASEQSCTRQQAARQRAARERQQRVEQALEQLSQIRQAKRGTQEKQEARASLSDPQARVMKQAGGGFAPSYNVQVSTEASHKIIVGVSTSQSGSDYGQLSPAIERVEQNLGAKPKELVADGGFTCRADILSTAAQGIDFYGSWGEQEQKAAGKLSQQGIGPEFYPQSFQYDAAKDQYCCAAGQVLGLVGQRQGLGVLHYHYQAQASVCQACAHQGRCCPQSQQGRSICRSVDTPEVLQFRQKMQTPQAQQIYKQRAPVAEFPNAWIKQKLGLRQFRLRGLFKVGLEALWACLTYNIQQWIRLCWRPSLVAAQN